MLVYDNHERIRILLALRGSVLYRVIPVGFFIAVITTAVNVYLTREEGIWWKPRIKNPWAANMIGTAISFAIVYRTSIAWSRYWEAAQQSHFMFSKWADSFTQLISFINTADRTIEKDPNWNTKPEVVDKKNKLSDLRYSLAHNFSLLSAMGAHRLTHGDMARMRRRSEKFGIKSSWLCFLHKLILHWDKLIVNRQDLRYNDYTGAFEMPRFRVFSLKQTCEEVRAKIQKQKRVNKATSTMEALRAGTSVMDSMMTALRSKSSAVDEAATENTLSQDGEPVARLETLASCASNVTWCSDLAILGALTIDEQEVLDGHTSTETHEHVQSAPDRVILISVWINEDINDLVSVCGTPPPIISRCYQELSNGMLGFNQALKMADIPFPFPFSQLLELLLVTFTMIIPFYTAVFTQGMIATPVLAFFITIGFWSLSEISRELEDPFGDGPNQLPIIDMHERFVELLRQIYHTKRPAAPRPWERKSAVAGENSVGTAASTG